MVEPAKTVRRPPQIVAEVRIGLDANGNPHVMSQVEGPFATLDVLMAAARNILGQLEQERQRQAKKIVVPQGPLPLPLMGGNGKPGAQ